MQEPLRGPDSHQLIESLRYARRHGPPGTFCPMRVGRNHVHQPLAEKQLSCALGRGTHLAHQARCRHLGHAATTHHLLQQIRALLERSDRPVEVVIGKAIRVRDGAGVTLISTGGMLKRAMEASDLLSARGIETRVLSMHTIKPLDEAAIVSSARETGGVVTLEEHSVIGGLGGATAEVIAEQAPGTRFTRVGLPSAFVSKGGDQEHLLAAAGLSPNAIADRVAASLSSRAQ